MLHSRLSNILALALAVSVGCKAQGSFSADLSESKQPNATTTSASASTTSQHPQAPAPKHERVPFTWHSTDAGRSGHMETTLPDGEQFSGQFHQITSATTVTTVTGFHSLWYGDPWAGPDWWWDGEWPYYPPEEFIRYYSGRVVAVLTSDRGKSMRCDFHLDTPERGMKSGGQGDCQVSNGERITAVFPSS